MKKEWVSYVALVIFSIFSFIPVAYADIYWESEVASKGLPNQPDGTRIEKHYFTPNASRVELADGSIMIMNFDSMTMYQLNPSNKTYTEMKMDDFQLPEDVPGMDREALEKMMGAQIQSMKVTPTKETKTIEGYQCTKYIVSMMGMNSDYWVSKDVKGFDEMEAIGKKAAKVFEKNPMMKQMNVLDLMNKVDGFPVQTVMHIMGGQMTSTLKKIEQMDLPADLFKVPGGYKVERAAHN